MLPWPLEESWLRQLQNQFSLPYFQTLLAKLQAEKEMGKIVYPDDSQVFQAFNSCRFQDIKVVILGQDPYHGPGQAHGLAFSVPENVPLPPSLRNIFKELSADLGTPPATSGSLQHWANQGVLLLNSTLTVRAHEAASHQKFGWETFTDQVIRLLSHERQAIIFLLWGNAAHKKAALINQDKHLVLKAAHPSPLSAYNGYFGCRHFSQTNHYLKSNGVEEIYW